jgi:signal transduction histidine kinase
MSLFPVLLLAAFPFWSGSDALQLERERVAVEKRLAELPARRPHEPNAAVGFHSRWSSKEQVELSVTVDLGEVHRVDSIFVVPACPTGGWGYGFPKRYRVEVSLDSEFRSPLVVLDRTGQDQVVPSGPVQVRSGGVSARYVRFVATKLFRQPNWDHGHMFCLGEILVFSGGRNVALGARVLSADAQGTNFPAWSQENLVDGYMGLGLPVLSDLYTSKTINSGWHSLHAKEPDTPKWVQVDLGREVTVQEIRIVPAMPVTFTYRPGFGFPVRFKIELSQTPGFEHPVTVVDWTGTDYPNPGDNLVMWRVKEVRARYVRFTATRLFLRWNDYVFSLAELEVYAGGVNVARGASVSCPEVSPNSMFRPEYLVDGRSSSGELIDLHHWLSALALRSELEQRVDTLRGLEEKARLRERKALAVAGAVLGGVLVAGVVGVIWRGRRVRSRELQALRQQIARDLHDEIGSSLGSIALASELGRRAGGGSESLSEIHQLATEAADSMRGILWMIRDGEAPALAQLEKALREEAGRALRGLEVRFQSESAPTEKAMPLEWHRHLFLFFKESLHNIARHSRAAHARIRLAWEPRKLLLLIEDDGCGFDAKARFAGSGLANMRHRAMALKALLRIDSAAGAGTRIELEVPL